MQFTNVGAGEDLTLAHWLMASRNCSGPVKKMLLAPLGQ